MVPALLMPDAELPAEMTAAVATHTREGYVAADEEVVGTKPPRYSLLRTESQESATVNEKSNTY